MGRKETARMLVTLFVVANLLGVLAALELQAVPAVQEAAAMHQTAASGLWFFALVGVATLLLLALYKYNVELLVKLWFGAAIFTTTLILVTAFLPQTVGVIVTVVLLVLRFKTRDMLLRNVFDLIAFAGAGALFGSVLGVLPAFILLVLLAGYDYISVFFTKHMIALAEAGSATDTFMGFTYPRAETPQVDTDADIPDDVPTEKMEVGMLGGGDVIIPMIFAITLLEYSVFATLAAILGATVALYLLMTKTSPQKFYPAIPALATGLLSGFILWFLTTLL